MSLLLIAEARIGRMKEGGEVKMGARRMWGRGLKLRKRDSALLDRR